MMATALCSAVRRLPGLALKAVASANQRLFSPDDILTSRWAFQVAGGPAMLPDFGADGAGGAPASVFDEAILRMAVPKSKVSPSRKRMKWQQHIPDRVEWSVCVKCGEPRRPHRICTAHMDICAMRDDEWKAHKARTAGEEKS